MKKVEIALWHRCNCQCVFCAGAPESSDGMLPAQAKAVLRQYRKLGADSVDFGGGEPTVYPGLMSLISTASTLGYERIGIKSNGMKFCYPEYVEECLAAGVNEFYISQWGHNPQVHDPLAGRRRAFEMTEIGLKHLVHFGADVCIDFLITTLTCGHIREAVERLSGIGVRKFRMWLFSIFGAGGERASLLPRMSAAGAAVAEAARAVEGKADFLITSHIPPCMLGGRRELYFNIKELELMIVTPGGSFPAEDSPFEVGVRVAACGGCSCADICPGPRKEYVEMFGGGEFSPVA